MIFNSVIVGAGGGAGSSIKVAAHPYVKNYTEGDKVFLLDPSRLGGGNLQVTNDTNDTSTVSFTRYIVASELMPFSSRFRWNGGGLTLTTSDRVNYTASWADPGDPIHWDVDPSIGIVTDWTYPETEYWFVNGYTSISKIYETGLANAYCAYPNGVPGGFVGKKSGGNCLAFTYDSSTRTVDSNINAPYSGFFMVHNGDLYYAKPENSVADKINKGSFTALSTVSISGGSLVDGGITSALTEDGEYIATWTNASSYFRILKMDKTSEPWVITSLGTVTIPQGGSIQVVRAKDIGNTVEVFIVPWVCTDEYNVVHVSIDKSTDTITERAPLLDSRGYDHIATCAFDNAMTRAAFVLSKTSGGAKICVSGLNSVVPYQFAAFSVSSDYVYPEVLTGFIKTNDGVDSMGNTVFTVETILDPDTPPFNPTGVVFGMNVTVFEGDPS